MPASGTGEPADAFARRLQAIFAGEACAHLARVEAGLAALAQAAAPAAALAAPVLEALHTLAGAARAVERGELELLCRALESVFAAAARCGSGLAAAHVERIGEAVALAGMLLDTPSARVRGQALALTGQLEALARALAAPQPP